MKGWNTPNNHTSFSYGLAVNELPNYTLVWHYMGVGSGKGCALSHKVFYMRDYMANFRGKRIIENSHEL